MIIIGEKLNGTIKSVAQAIKERDARFVRDLIARVSVFKPELVIVLTYTPAFFAKLGFVEIAKTEIMHKIYSGCINCTKQVNPFTCPEVAMGLRLKP